MTLNTLTQALPKPVRRVFLLIALTAGLSLLYALQYYLGGPLRPSVTSEIHDLDLNPRATLVAPAERRKSAWTAHVLSGHNGPVVRVFFEPRGAALYSAGRDGTVRRWDVSSMEMESVLDVPGGSPLNDASLAADGSTLAVIGEDGVIHVWDVRDGASVIQSIDTGGSARRAVALSSDGSLVAADDGNNIQIWDVRSGEPVQRLEGYWEDEATKEDWLGHDKEVTTLAFSPGDTLLA
jgi:WD40 repeat protein